MLLLRPTLSTPEAQYLWKKLKFHLDHHGLKKYIYLSTFNQKIGMEGPLYSLYTGFLKACNWRLLGTPQKILNLAEHDGRYMTKKKMENKKYRNVNGVFQE